MMTNAQRVTNIIERKPVDYLPSQITFADLTREQEIAKALHVEEGQSLAEYLQNCLRLTYAQDDLPLVYMNFEDMMLSLEKQGFTHVDLKNGIVYDRLGMGIKMHDETFIMAYCPLEGDAEKDKLAGDYLPESITKLYGLPLEEKIKRYEIPDGAVDGALDWMLRDFEQYSGGQNFLFPAGPYGIYERAYSLIGWEQYMMEIAARPTMIHELMDKVAEYKVQQARKKVKEIPSIVHHIGDDLGTQLAGMFSLPMFREMIKPYLKRVFDVYKSAGCYVCMHSCGYVMDYLPDLIDIGLDMLEPIQTCNDMATLKREFGKDLIFWGGIETQKLPFLPPEGVREITKEAMWTLGKGGGLIIGPSQYITSDVPIENIKAMVETIIEEREKVV